MTARPPVIDADGHILERQSDVRKYIEPPWNRRPTPLWPSDQPWDTNLFETLGFHSEYRSGMSPREQVDAWVRVLDREGIERAVCFPTGSGSVTKLQEPSFAAVVARATNNHFASDYNSLSDRVQVVGVLPLQDPLEAARELNRAFTELGLMSFEILSTGLRLPLGDPIYDPVYAEAERLGCPLSIHGTRSGAHEVGSSGYRTFNEVHTYAFPASVLLHFTSVIYNAVPLRFPKLRLSFLEIGATWIPYWLDRMDEHWEKRGEFDNPTLTRKPSELVRGSPIYFTLEAGETLLPQTVGYLGDNHFMYASDFPHWDSEFPKNLKEIWDHPALSAGAKEKILSRNAIDFYGLARSGAGKKGEGGVDRGKS